MRFEVFIPKGLIHCSVCFKILDYNSTHSSGTCSSTCTAEFVKMGACYAVGEVYKPNLNLMVNVGTINNCIVDIKGNRFYHINKVLHREDNPAIEYTNGDKYWYHDGINHREGGPAIEAQGVKLWFNNGKLHREDGPAIYDSFMKRYYLNGKKIDTREEYDKIIKFKAFL